MDCAVYKLLPLLILLPLTISSKAHAEEFTLPDEVVEIAEIYETESISSELIQAVIWTESRGNAEAVSADGYNSGLMQLHKWYFTGELTDPLNNVKQGVEYLDGLYEKYENIETALMIYHGEANAVSRAANGEYSDYALGIINLTEEIKREEKWNYTRLIGESCSVSTRKPERLQIWKRLTHLRLKRPKPLKTLFF